MQHIRVKSRASSSNSFHRAAQNKLRVRTWKIGTITLVRLKSKTESNLKDFWVDDSAGMWKDTPHDHVQISREFELICSSDQTERQA